MANQLLVTKTTKCLTLALSELKIGNEHAASVAATRAGTLGAKAGLTLSDLTNLLVGAALGEQIFLTIYLTEGYIK